MKENKILVEDELNIRETIIELLQLKILDKSENGQDALNLLDS
jgi:hypothetical protein